MSQNNNKRTEDQAQLACMQALHPLSVESRVRVIAALAGLIEPRKGQIAEGLLEEIQDRFRLLLRALGSHGRII
jgi:hypothetical protein